mmetsp:Transcript_43251/g.106776  ORF Transcript_43251/g.106776 Transcript_43251/m.106776 type:complete len:427 (+) Transcript_43251:937-2217(+)
MALALPRRRWLHLRIRLGVARAARAGEQGRVPEARRRGAVRAAAGAHRRVRGEEGGGRLRLRLLLARAHRGGRRVGVGPDGGGVALCLVHQRGGLGARPPAHPRAPQLGAAHTRDARGAATDAGRAAAGDRVQGEVADAHRRAGAARAGPAAARDFRRKHRVQRPRAARRGRGHPRAPSCAGRRLRGVQAAARRRAARGRRGGAGGERHLCGHHAHAAASLLQRAGGEHHHRAERARAARGGAPLRPDWPQGAVHAVPHLPPQQGNRCGRPHGRRPLCRARAGRAVHPVHRAPPQGRAALPRVRQAAQAPHRRHQVAGGAEDRADLLAARQANTRARLSRRARTRGAALALALSSRRALLCPSLFPLDAWRLLALSDPAAPTSTTEKKRRVSRQLSAREAARRAGCAVHDAARLHGIALNLTLIQH